MIHWGDCKANLISSTSRHYQKLINWLRRFCEWITFLSQWPPIFEFENKRINDYFLLINCCPWQMFIWSLYLRLKNFNEVAHPWASLSQSIFSDHDWWESFSIYFHLNSLTLNYAGKKKHSHYWKDAKHWLVHPQNV